MNRRLFILSAAALLAAPALFAVVLTQKPSKPLHISEGKPVNLEDYLIPGKTTVFDFYSVYCGPCMAIAPQVEGIHTRRADVVVIKVDINRPGVKGIDWHSPVAQQFKLHSIPHFKVYGPDGKLKAEDGPDGAPARKIVTGWFK
jgi:thiol-disulfide isomerase/thioredoxin